MSLFDPKVESIVIRGKTLSVRSMRTAEGFIFRGHVKAGANNLAAEYLVACCILDENGKPAFKDVPEVEAIDQGAFDELLDAACKINEIGSVKANPTTPPAAN